MATSGFFETRSNYGKLGKLAVIRRWRKSVFEAISESKMATSGFSETHYNYGEWGVYR